MTEQVEENAVEEGVVEVDEQTQKALDNGWKPLDQWEGEQDDWVPAKEFNKRGELIGRIVSQSRKIEKLEKVTKELADHYSKVKETEFNRAVAALKAQKVEAIREGDAEKVVALDDKLDEMKGAQPVQPVASEAFAEWIEDNGWYDEDIELKEAADGIARGFIAKAQRAGKPVTEKEVLDHVSKTVKERFKAAPATQRKTVAPVESGTQARKSSGKPKFTRRDLSPVQKQVMDNFVAKGVMTEEQYIADLVKMGEVA